MLAPPGSSRSRGGSVRGSTSSARRKTQDTPDDVIRKIQRLPPNKRCADCQAKLPQCVNLTHCCFVCMACSGVHREFSHRVKGIGHSSFTAEEVERMRGTDAGNEAVNARYLAAYSPSTDRLKAPQDNHDQQLLRVWIRRKYKDKAWYRAEGEESTPAAGGSRQPKGSAARGPTRAKIPPKKAAAAAPAVDLLGFDSAPAPAPPAPAPPAPPSAASESAPGQSWDAFGGSSNQQQSSQQSNFNSAFGAQQPAPAPPQQNAPVPPQQQQPQQQHGAFQGNFGQAQNNAPPAQQQQAQQPQQQSGGFQANFGQTPPPQPQTQQGQLPMGQQQQAAGFQANFGQMSPQQQQQPAFQTNFGQMPQGQQQQGQMPQGQQQQGQMPQGQQQQGQMPQGQQQQGQMPHGQQQQPAFQTNFGQQQQGQLPQGQQQQPGQSPAMQQVQQQASFNGAAFGQQTQMGGQAAGGVGAQGGQPQQPGAQAGSFGQAQPQQGQQQQAAAQQQGQQQQGQGQGQQQQNGFANFGQAQMQQQMQQQPKAAAAPTQQQQPPSQQPVQQQAAAAQLTQQQATTNQQQPAPTMEPPPPPSNAPPAPPAPPAQPAPPPPPVDAQQTPTMGMGMGMQQPGGVSSGANNKVDDAFASLSLEPPSSGQSASAGAQTKQIGSKFKEGQSALYSNSQQNGIKVTVMKVHYDDDLEPYYTVSLPDGKEKQTDDAHLTPPSDDPPSNSGHDLAGQGMQQASSSSQHSMSPASEDTSPEITQIVGLLRGFGPQQLQHAYQVLSQMSVQNQSQANPAAAASTADPAPQAPTATDPGANQPQLQQQHGHGQQLSTPQPIQAQQTPPQAPQQMMQQQAHHAQVQQQQQQPVQSHQQMPQMQMQQQPMHHTQQQMPQMQMQQQPMHGGQQQMPQLQQGQGQQMMASPSNNVPGMAPPPSVPAAGAPTGAPPAAPPAAAPPIPAQKKEGNPFDKF